VCLEKLRICKNEMSPYLRRYETPARVSDIDLNRKLRHHRMDHKVVMWEEGLPVNFAKLSRLHGGRVSRCRWKQPALGCPSLQQID
jgi:hypothetical protein